MNTRATMPCDKGCGGSGIVKREVRKLEDGKPDPLDFRHQELCPACGGEGVVTNWGSKPRPANDRKPGFVCDQIHGSFHDTLHETAFTACNHEWGPVNQICEGCGARMPEAGAYC